MPETPCGRKDWVWLIASEGSFCCIWKGMAESASHIRRKQEAGSRHEVVEEGLVFVPLFLASLYSTCASSPSSPWHGATHSWVRPSPPTYVLWKCPHRHVCFSLLMSLSLAVLTLQVTLMLETEPGAWNMMGSLLTLNDATNSWTPSGESAILIVTAFISWLHT